MIKIKTCGTAHIYKTNGYQEIMKTRKLIKVFRQRNKTKWRLRDTRGYTLSKDKSEKKGKITYVKKQSKKKLQYIQLKQNKTKTTRVKISKY